MLKKAWEAIALLVVLVIVVNIIIVSLTPYFPVVGLTVLLVIAGVLVKTFWFKRKHW